MNKFRNVPAIITLLAGFIACVVMIIRRYTVTAFLWQLIFVMTAFYILGLLIRLILNKVFKEPEDESEDDEGEDTKEDSESDTPDA